MGNCCCKKSPINYQPKTKASTSGFTYPSELFNYELKRKWTKECGYNYKKQILNIYINLFNLNLNPKKNYEHRQRDKNYLHIQTNPIWVVYFDYLHDHEINFHSTDYPIFFHMLTTDKHYVFGLGCFYCQILKHSIKKKDKSPTVCRYASYE